MADPISSRGTATPPSESSFAKKWQIDRGYVVTLTVTGDETLGGTFSVSTNLDESFSISLGSTWNAPYENAMQDAANSVGGKAGAALKIGQAVGQAAGFQGRSPALSAQVWQTSDPVGFNIPFTFVATTDPATEVRDKVLNLLKLVAPSEALDGLALKAPGPTLIGQIKKNGETKGRKIQLKIGEFLLLDNCVVTNVDAQFDSIIGASGIPHKAKVTVDVKSFYTCFTVQDLDKLFRLK